MPTADATHSWRDCVAGGRGRVSPPGVEHVADGGEAGWPRKAFESRRPGDVSYPSSASLSVAATTLEIIVRDRFEEKGAMPAVRR
jgi:hypothetical protein